MSTFSSSPVPFQEQYELVHKAIAQLFEKQLQLLESPTNAQIHDSMVRHTRSCCTLWRGRKTGCRWVICSEWRKTEIISHRGGKGRPEREQCLQKTICSNPYGACAWKNSGSEGLWQLDPLFLLIHCLYLNWVDTEDMWDHYRAKKVQRDFTTSIILKAQRSQTLDRRSGSAPALHFLLVEALMTSSPSHNAPRLRIDIRWERQALASWASVFIREETHSPVLFKYFFNCLCFISTGIKKTGLSLWLQMIKGHIRTCTLPAVLIRSVHSLTPVQSTIFGD